MGLPLVIFGTAGSTLLPRTGVWMRTIQYVFGFLFLGVAVWMSSRVLPAQVTLALWAMLLIGTGVFLGAFDSIAGDATPWGRARQAGSAERRVGKEGGQTVRYRGATNN